MNRKAEIAVNIPCMRRVAQDCNMDEMDMQDYYLIRIMEEKYVWFFEGKETLYMNLLSKYRGEGNNVQYDEEESVLAKSNEKGKIKLTIFDTDPTKETSTINDVKHTIEVEDMRHDCYVYCFFLIPKNVIAISQEGIGINSEIYYNDLLKALDGYGKSAIFIIDMEKFMKTVKITLPQISYGKVEYYNHICEKARGFTPQNLMERHFLKNKKYAYLHEFRLLLPQLDKGKDHIEINIPGLKRCIVWRGIYCNSGEKK